MSDSSNRQSGQNNQTNGSSMPNVAGGENIRVVIKGSTGKPR